MSYAGTDPEMLHGGGGGGGYQYFTILNYEGWLTGNDRPTPIVFSMTEFLVGNLK